jgi:Ca2+-binding EF-hand superfamily protein
MKVSFIRAGVLAAAVVFVGSGFALADNHGGAQPAGKKGKKAGVGQGQHWDQFAKQFDANGDGKVSKEEFLGKRPGFDKMDGNHDGAVTPEEVKAMPAVQAHGGTGQNFVAHFDADKDGKVSTAEYDAKRGEFFDKVDKNKDGVIDQSELKTQPPTADMGV